jgi:hypothetical protein
MSQSLNLIQDLEFTETAATKIVGGLSIAHRPIDICKWGGCFPHPRPPVHPIRPIHPPIFDIPHPRPLPFPKHIRDLGIVGGPIMTTNH